MPTPERYRVTLITEDQQGLGPVEGHIEAPKSVVLICDDPADPTRGFFLAQERSLLRCERLRDGRTEREWAALERATREARARQQQAQETTSAEHQARVEREEAERQARAAEGVQLSEEERREEWRRRLEELKQKREQGATEAEQPAPEAPATAAPTPGKKPRKK